MHCSRSRRRSKEPALSLTTKQLDIIGTGAAQQLPTYTEETCRVAHAPRIVTPTGLRSELQRQ